MPSIDLVMGAMRAHLVAAGVARLPRTDPLTAPAGARPLFLDPRKGAPSPDDKADLAKKADGSPLEWDAVAMVSAFPGSPIPTGRMYSSVPTFDLEIRCPSAQTAHQLGPAMTSLLVQSAAGSGEPRRNWDMGAGGQIVRVIESILVRELQEMGVDRQSYIYGITYGFEVYRP